MALKKRTIDFLNPINPPTDIWTSIYNWVFKIGRYILVGIESLLLLVFFSRFVLDEKNNDLTKEINDKVDILSNTEFKNQEILFRNTHLLLTDVNDVSKKQSLNSKTISEVTSAIPNALKLERFTFNSNKVSLYLTTNALKSIKDYEYSLRQNDKFDDIIVNINKDDTSNQQIEVNVTFVIKESKT